MEAYGSINIRIEPNLLIEDKVSFNSEKNTIINKVIKFSRRTGKA